MLSWYSLEFHVAGLDGQGFIMKWIDVASLLMIAELLKYFIWNVHRKNRSRLLYSALILLLCSLLENPFSGALQYMWYVLYRIASFMTLLNIRKNLFAYTFEPSLSMPESLLFSASPHSLPLSSLFYFLPSASYPPSQADGRGWGQSALVAMTPDSPCLVKARSFLCSISPEFSTGESVCLCVTALGEKKDGDNKCVHHMSVMSNYRSLECEVATGSV